VARTGSPKCPLDRFNRDRPGVLLRLSGARQESGPALLLHALEVVPLRVDVATELRLTRMAASWLRPTRRLIISSTPTSVEEATMPPAHFHDRYRQRPVVSVKLGLAGRLAAGWLTDGRPPRFCEVQDRPPPGRFPAAPAASVPMGTADSVRASRVALEPNLYGIPGIFAPCPFASRCCAVNTMAGVKQ
jgi:hypothetical protein